MIHLASIYHRTRDNFAYANDCRTLHLRLRSAKGDLKTAILRFGDPYDWESGGTGGNLNAENAYNWVGGTQVPMTLEGSCDQYDYWFVAVEPEYKRARYAFIVSDGVETYLIGEKKNVRLTESNQHKEYSNIHNFYCFPYINKADLYQSPEWVKDAVFYHIFPERFHNGKPEISPKQVVTWGSIDPSYDTFFGGDLYGVYEKLDYLQDLGINAIYFCPITEGASNHKYDTIDYFKVDPHFGDDDMFKKLVDEAHRRGMKVMLDAVFNHIGYLAPQWQDVLAHGEASRYKDWFHISAFPVLDKPMEEITDKHGINFETFGFTPHMPKLNTDNEVVVQYLLDVATYWVKVFDIDGWRLDVANEVDHRFWRRFRDAVKAVKPELYIVGEVWHDAMPWLSGDQFDAVMNYPVSEAIVDFIAKGSDDSQAFMARINANRFQYPLPVYESMFNLLDSHDTARILTQCGESIEKVKLAYTVLMTLPGVPCIYYGSEIAMTGGHDPLCRKCMQWDEEKQDLEFKAWMMQLIRMRKENAAAKSSQLKWLSLDHPRVVAYEKSDIQGERLLVIINASDAYADIHTQYEAGELVMSAETIALNDVRLRPYESMIIRLKR